MRKTLLSLVLAMLATPVFAAGIAVSHATLRVITPVSPAAGYFDVANDTARDVILTGARSPACGSLMMHQSTTDPFGLSRMVAAPRFVVPAHGRVGFKPGGYHLMCEHLALGAAHHATVTLLFEGGVTQDVIFTVVDAKGAPR